MTYHFTRVNKGISYLYRGKNKKVKGVSMRIEEESLGRLDEIESYILKRAEEYAEVEVKEFGLSSTLLSIAKKLNIETGFEELIKSKKDKRKLSRALMLIVLYNICHKGGKLSLQSWYQRSNLSSSYDVPLEELEAYNLCRDMDLLEPCIDAVEKLICFNILALDNKEMEILFFDTTNQYVYVENRDSELLYKNGNNKANRYDLKQFNLALTVSAKSGIPLFHKVYPGNVNDAAFFGDYINELTDKIRETGSEPKGKLLIFDKGNNSPDNISKVLGLKYDIIGSLRPSSYKELVSTPISELTKSVTIDENKVKYKDLTLKVYGRDMKVVLTFDEKTKKRRMHTFEDNLLKIQRDVLAFQEHISSELKKERKSKWRKDGQIIKKAKTLVSKHYSRLFEFEVNRTADYTYIVVKIVPEEYDKLQLAFGKNILFTNKLDLPSEEVIRLYRLKDFVEKLFEYLKNFKLILLEPTYHRLDKRIKVNTYLKVIAMQILAYLNKSLKENKSSLKIFEAIDELKSIHKLHYANKETKVMRELPVSLNEKQKELIKKLGVEM